MTSDIAELIDRLETTPPGRHGADDCWQAAAVLQAQQAEITMLRELLEDAASVFSGDLAGDVQIQALEQEIEAVLAQKESAQLSHDWGPSQVGHGESQCRRCLITNREAQALGRMNKCEVAQKEPAE